MNNNIVNKELTPKEKLFAMEYLTNDFNASQACRVAYPNVKNVKAYSFNLINRLHIKEYISVRVNKILTKKELKAEDVIAEYAKIGFAKITDYLEYDNNSLILKPSAEVDSANIAEVSIETYGSGENERKKVKIKLQDKLKALDSLARYFGLFKDKAEVSGTLTIGSLLKSLKESKAKTEARI